MRPRSLTIRILLWVVLLDLGLAAFWWASGYLQRAPS